MIGGFFGGLSRILSHEIAHVTVLNLSPANNVSVDLLTIHST